MKVLLITEVFPPQPGGSGRWFWEIYRRREPAQTLILAAAQSGDHEFDETHSLRVERASMNFPTWGVVNRDGFACYRRLAERAERLIRAHDPVQVHCGKVLPEGFVAWWLRRKLGLPYLVYVHGEELNIAAGSRELRWMTRRVLGSAARVVANSQNTARLLRDDWCVSEDQLRAVHPGVDTALFQPQESDQEFQQRLGWQRHTVILTVGRLQKRKGHDAMIAALPEILKSVPDALYAIVGDGEEYDFLRREAIRLGVEGKVQFLRSMDDQELLKSYQNCDVFILPNRTVENDIEGFGMVLVEAQACGIPVLAGDSGGTAETMVVGKTGWIVDCTNPDRIADAVVRLCSLGRDERLAIGQAGRQWVVGNLDWSSLSRQIELCFPRPMLAQ